MTIIGSKKIKKTVRFPLRAARTPSSANPFWIWPPGRNRMYTRRYPWRVGKLMLSCSAARPNDGILTPSTAFSRLAKKIREFRPENCTGGLMKTDIRPFAPVFALEALAVRLRETGDIGESFLQSRDPEDRLWKNALGSLAGSEAWKPKLDGVLNGLRVTAPAGRITPEEVRGLYASHGMTISRVETFSACPYRHFLQ